MKKKLLIILAVLVLLILGFLWYSQTSKAPQVPSRAMPESSIMDTDNTPKNRTKKFNKKQFSLTKASSLWVIVNKLNPLNPIDYKPSLTVPDIPLRSNITDNEKYVSTVMAPALEAMARAAKTHGLIINLQSGYRSYQFQVSLYNRYVANEGRAKADTFSARPGHSEHQTGLAADLGGTSQPGCNVDQCFANTAEGKWLAANAWKYGFILRYPKGMDNITGYEYEPWHFRYVGKPLAEQLHKTKTLTLEQFFGLPPAPSYR